MRLHGAASSIASGNPSRRRQIETTSAALSSVKENPEAWALARSTKSLIAAECASVGEIGLALLCWQGERRQGNLALAADP